MNEDPQHDAAVHGKARKASLGQLAATVFWGLCMIGKKGTWERNGVTVTLGQIVVGAIVGGAVIVGLLLLLARLAARGA